MNAAGIAPMDVVGRAAGVRSMIRAKNLDGLAVTSLVNIRWLTGFTGSNAIVLVTDDRLVLFTDGRYADQAPAELENAGVDGQVLVGNDLLALIFAEASGLSSLGLEADHVSWADQRKIADGCSSTLVPLTGALAELRAVKDVGEVDRARRAAAIADAALGEVRGMLREEPTERDVALALDRAMQAHGATSSAYETIVASGPNAALPHARPGWRVVQSGDLVIIDVGALVEGYRSDMTRSFIVGEPTAAQSEHLEVVRAAQAAGVALVADGAAARDVDDACREVIAEAGWADAFVHGTGHGVGLEIHELPRVNSSTDDVLVAGMLVTVEPGAYFAGVGGVRWEDLLLVTEGGAEALTRSPKEARV